MKRSKIMISLLILFVAFVSCKSKVGSCPKFDGNDQVQYDGNGLVKKRK